VFKADKVLKIMLNLQQKAHVALHDFREGKTSGPPSNGLFSHPHDVDTTEVDSDDDELSKLGGKTRLISQKESSKSPSPPATSSPLSHNPIVPLPLADPNVMEAHPSVREYLQTFSYGSVGNSSHSSPGADALSAAGHAHADHTMFAVNGDEAYGPSTRPSPAINLAYMGGSGGYHAPVSNVHEHTQSLGASMDALSDSPLSSHSSGAGEMHTMFHGSAQPSPALGQEHSQGQGQASYFPQYFPVFDYGPTSAQHDSFSSIHVQPPSTSSVLSRYEQDSAMAYEAQSLHPNSYDVHGQHSRRQSMTPEAPSGVMHNTWMDFVQQMSMNS